MGHFSRWYGPKPSVPFSRARKDAPSIRCSKCAEKFLPEDIARDDLGALTQLCRTCWETTKKKRAIPRGSGIRWIYMKR